VNGGIGKRRMRAPKRTRGGERDKKRGGRGVGAARGVAGREGGEGKTQEPACPGATEGGARAWVEDAGKNAQKGGMNNTLRSC